MAYVKILNIKKMSHVFRSIEYVENEEKTNVAAIPRQFPVDGSAASNVGSMITKEQEGIEIGEENSDIRTAISNLVGYTTNKAKTADRTLVTGINCTTHHAAEEMRSLVEFWKKEKQITGVSRDAFHIIQSFDPNHNPGLSPETVHEIGRKYCDALTHMDDKRMVNRRYMMLLSTHVDKAHLHNHIILCSYDMDTGRKFHECKEVYRQMKEASDRLCREYGLAVIDAPDPGRSRSRGEWKQTKADASWKDRVRKDIDAMRSVSSGWGEFRAYMSSIGYGMKEGRNVTYTTPDGHRVRDRTLGREWTKDEIEKSWIPQQDKEGGRPNTQRQGDTDTQAGKSSTTDNERSNAGRFYRDGEKISNKRKREKGSSLWEWDDIPVGKKTTLAMILLIAIEIMKEPDSFRGGIWFSDMRTAASPEKEKDYRVKRLENALSVAKQEGVQTQEELKARMDECGAALSHARKQLRKSREKLNWMEIAINALTDYQKAVSSLEGSHETSPKGQASVQLKNEPVDMNEGKKPEDESEKAQRALSVLRRYGCTTSEKVVAFKEEHARLKETIQGYTARVNSLRREYKRLVRIRQGLELAGDEGFLHGGYYQEPPISEKVLLEEKSSIVEKKPAEKEKNLGRMPAEETVSQTSEIKPSGGRHHENFSGERSLLRNQQI